MNSAPTNLTINGGNATIYGDLTFAVTNGINIVDGTNIFTAVVNGTMTNSTREMLPVSLNLRNDQNGNLIWDGLKAYSYDCANELTQVMVMNSFKTMYAYDGFGRRRVRQDYTWTGSAWSKTNEVRYVYDGMTVIQERNISNNPLVSYTRGVDLSGSQQGAGGIGGLLARTDANGSAYYHADGNGNVTMMVDSSGTVQAKYLYDSFGNTLGMWGALASANTYRFSSKEIDLKTGLYYYSYRYYEPNLQRWLNRDPTGEFGGINLYDYVGNDPMNWIDTDGLAPWRLEPGHGSNPNNPDGWHIQLGDNRWDARTLQPLPGNTQAALTPGQLDELRQAGILDKAKKLFPGGVVAQEAERAGLSAEKLLKLSGTMAKPLCKALGRVAGPLALVGAASDVKAIGVTAATGAQAASAANDAINSSIDTQKKVNAQLNSGDDLSDDDITHYMQRRVGGYGH